MVSSIFHASITAVCDDAMLRVKHIRSKAAQSWKTEVTVRSMFTNEEALAKSPLDETWNENNVHSRRKCTLFRILRRARVTNW